MRTLLIRTAAFAAVALLSWAAPANAVELPEEPALLYLKDHPDLPMTWTDEGAVFAEGGQTLWRLVPPERDNVAEPDYEGAIAIVHDETGQCLAAEAMAEGAIAAPVKLVDCVEEPWWQVLTDTRAGHHDARFITPEGHMLGAPSNTVADGQAVEVHDVEKSLHSQEWRFASSGSPSPTPSSVPSEAPPGQETPVGQASQPKLPQTGAGIAAAAVGGLAAVTAGAVLTLWWRRKTLRTQW
ncbi:LPXTG cell wall anchor domain-containing protein [Glycomyces tarimensis]